MSQRYLGGVITANPTTPTLASASGVWTLEQQFQNLSGIQPKRISNSVRLRSSANASFSRTPASAGNQQTWTWSGWVKRGSLDTSSYYTLFASGNNVVDSLFAFRFASGTGAVNDQLWIRQYNPSTGSYDLDVSTTAVYRDPSAWYHVVLVYNSANATSTDRLIIYVNGTRQAVSYTAGPVPLNKQSQINMARLTTMGVFTTSTSINYFDGYLTEINFIDGQALTPSSFGAFDSTGVWQPLGYTGTYGTNGFYLNFSDTSGATATTIGKDSSGNGNNWTPNNISVTAGSTYDAMIDSPTNYATGTAYGVGNYATLNPLSYYLSATLSNANLSVSLGTTGNSRATLAPVTGKWYAEYTCTSAGGYSGTGLWIGSAAADFSTPFMSVSYYSNGQTYNNSTFSYVSYGASWTTNDLIGVAWDCDTQQVTFYKNGVSQGTLTSPSISVTTGGAGFAFIPSSYLSGVTSTFSVNFGQRPFAYTPPTGFKALNTANLPAATINNGAQYMAATLWTATGSAVTINNGTNNTIGTSFQPDLIWTKSRSDAESHRLSDSVRGGNGTVLYELNSNETTAEGTDTLVNGFASNGFTIASGANSPNVSGRTYVGWQWKAGGTSSSNTNGSITSTVSVGATQGFSVVTYTGTGANATVGHGLGVAPSMIIVKSRANATDWIVGHSSLNFGTDAWMWYLSLNLTTAQTTTALTWNNTAPTSTVFSLGSSSNTNPAATMVAYCFAAVAGYSAFGRYNGNGSDDGPFVYCGFRPRYVLIKRTDASDNWFIHDTSRNPSNIVNLQLKAQSSDAEASTVFDIVSNGFKVRNSFSGYNASGGTYIYAAFAENPFNTSRAR
jgi:hypothetical protein